MKHLMLVFAAILLGVAVYAQTAGSDARTKAASVLPPVNMKVNLSGDKLVIVYKNQEIPAANVQVLDSLIKTVKDPKTLNIEFEAFNRDDAKNQAVSTVLKKCQCPVSKHSIKVNPNH
jgi:hypothetical protein